MNYIVNEKLNENPLYVRYLRENSHWYKLLNRNPEKINDMINEMKVRYQMRPSDKITNSRCQDNHPKEKRMQPP